MYYLFFSNVFNFLGHGDFEELENILKIFEAG